MVIATAASSSPLNQFFPIIIVVALFALMYFFMIRPQSKRRKEAMEMQRTLGVGSDVVTIGGLYGTVVETDDESVTLEIDEGVTARYTRQAVARVLPAPAETAPAAESDADDTDDAEDEAPAAEAEQRPAADDDERPSDALSATAGDGTQAPKLSKES
ncbi:preprotein translocase subunit YajC [Fodinicola acaciae]|uniref:preprotein translocase subunit YajC n=1 Tax=Fodinicola acaciae TaxID=2681555 RepID=UPI002483B899|nr:preprotein translocase subunit YajC [Fodinicola acaciae]